jgi:predicted neuraminidase
MADDLRSFSLRCLFRRLCVLTLAIPPAGCGLGWPGDVNPDLLLEFNGDAEAQEFTSAETAVFQAQPIFESIAGREGSHAASVVSLDDGELLAAWYSYTGPHELDGSAIYMARRPAGGPEWGAPLLHRDSPIGDANPVLYAEGDSVWLYQAVVSGGWSTSAIEYQMSADRGFIWSEPRRMVGPIGSNVRYPPVRLHDGHLLLPAYDDLLQRSLFFLSSDGQSWSLHSVVATSPPHQNIQPSVIPLETGRLLAMMRNTGKGWLWVMASDDGGATWSMPQDSGFANPASAAALLRLANNRLLLVFNDSNEQRSPLTASLSADQGRTWPHRRVVIDGKGDYSYPSAIQTPDGLIHIVYSFGRERIDHVTLNEDWIIEGTNP